MTPVRLEPGRLAPAFTLLDQDERSVALRDLRGGPVVVFFYPEAMTPGCTKEACDFRDSLAPLQGAGYTVLGVSRDDQRVPRRAPPTAVKVDGTVATSDAKGRIQHALYNVRATGHVGRLRTLLDVG